MPDLLCKIYLSSPDICWQCNAMHRQTTSFMYKVHHLWRKVFFLYNLLSLDKIACSPEMGILALNLGLVPLAKRYLL